MATRATAERRLERMFEELVMKIANDPTYDPEFPEEYHRWPMVESRRLEPIVEQIVRLAFKEQKTRARTYLPGLRRALNIIAEHEETL